MRLWLALPSRQPVKGIQPRLSIRETLVFSFLISFLLFQAQHRHAAKLFDCSLSPDSLGRS